MRATTPQTALIARYAPTATSVGHSSSRSRSHNPPADARSGLHMPVSRSILPMQRPQKGTAGAAVMATALRFAMAGVGSHRPHARRVLAYL